MLPTFRTTLSRILSGTTLLDTVCAASWPQLVRGAKKNANELRPGNVIDVDGRLLLISKFQYTQGLSRQLGNVQLELRDVQLNTKVSQRYRPGDTVEVAVLEERKFECLYTDGNVVHLMEPETYEQVDVDKSIFGESGIYLREQMAVEISYHKGNAIHGNVPRSVDLRVIETDPTSGGDSVNTKYKPAVVENGVKVSIPTFIQQNDVIEVNTTDNTFLKRKEKVKE